MLKFIYTKADLFNQVKEETLQISNRVGDKGKLHENRFPEVVPFTDNDQSFFNIQLNRVCPYVLEAIGAYTGTTDNDDIIDYPYQITDDTDTESPDSVIFKIIPPDEERIGRLVGLITSRMCEAIVSYIVQNWLISKMLSQEAIIFSQKFESAISNVRKNLGYGERASLTYRTF